MTVPKNLKFDLVETDLSWSNFLSYHPSHNATWFEIDSILLQVLASRFIKINLTQTICHRSMFTLVPFCSRTFYICDDIINQSVKKCFAMAEIAPSKNRLWRPLFPQCVNIMGMDKDNSCLYCLADDYKHYLKSCDAGKHFSTG